MWDPGIADLLIGASEQVLSEEANQEIGDPALFHAIMIHIQEASHV